MPSIVAAIWLAQVFPTSTTSNYTSSIFHHHASNPAIPIFHPLLPIDIGQSTIRAFILPASLPQAHPSGASALRFMLSTSDIASNPRTAHYVDRHGEIIAFIHGDRRIIAYPCRRNSQLNITCIHPDTLSAGCSTGWDKPVPNATMLEIFADFHEDVKALLGMAVEGSVRLWRIMDCERLDTVCCYYGFSRFSSWLLWKVIGWLC